MRAALAYTHSLTPLVMSVKVGRVTAGGDTRRIAAGAAHCCGSNLVRPRKRGTYGTHRKKAVVPPIFIWKCLRVGRLRDLLKHEPVGSRSDKLRMFHGPFMHSPERWQSGRMRRFANARGCMSAVYSQRLTDGLDKENYSSVRVFGDFCEVIAK